LAGKLIIDIQLNQGAAPWPALRDAAIAAEETGYSTLWNLDHFSGSMFRADSMLECFTCITAWAGVTNTIGLGTLVTNVMNREPGLLANIVSSVQQIAGDRFTLGIGAGTAPNSPWAGEQKALGLPLLPTMAERHARLAEVVDIMRGIWAHDRSDSFVGFPRPVSSPRIIAGINSVGLARVAGERLDGVNMRFNHPQRGEFIEAARTASADRSDFEVSVWAPFNAEFADPDHELHKELASEGVTRLILLMSDVVNVDAITSVKKYLN
jgi:alkanesulfonate monooxygenase SsuD/methylene tetrahydromethanopterin reductase-like flavin-dependent oxidoreductase (luciferase family)